jgi:hypothetical protein
MVHASDGEAWTHFDAIHHVKVEEVRNVHVALAIDGFNCYELMAVPYACWSMFVIPLNLPPRRMLSRTEHIFVVGNF